jgi:hypothetical protein
MLECPPDEMIGSRLCRLQLPEPPLQLAYAAGRIVPDRHDIRGSVEQHIRDELMIVKPSPHSHAHTSGMNTKTKLR